MRFIFSTIIMMVLGMFIALVIMGSIIFNITFPIFSSILNTLGGI